jgi:hypothetical protein
VEAFWQEFDDRFGPVGGDPAGFYCFELGNICHVLPADVGELTPADMVGALNMFDALYRAG